MRKWQVLRDDLRAIRPTEAKGRLLKPPVFLLKSRFDENENDEEENKRDENEDEKTYIERIRDENDRII